MLLGRVSWQAPTIESITAVAGLLDATSRVSVGPGVIQPPVRNAEVLNRPLRTLALMHPGRLHVGLGAGSRPEECQRFGLDYSQRWPQTQRRYEELLTGLAAASLNTAAGRYAISTPVWPAPGLARGAPGSALGSDVAIWMGGRSRPALRLAARTGAWLPLFTSPTRIAASLVYIQTTMGAKPTAGAVMFVGSLLGARIGVEPSPTQVDVSPLMPPSAAGRSGHGRLARPLVCPLMPPSAAGRSGHGRLARPLRTP
jgi:alkanesulfonate monooxygenase SsuD/methylene tetrahydromethanopterin reductase-like flavin-dependent oxidoreductase (luciferase family)